MSFTEGLQITVLFPGLTSQKIIKTVRLTGKTYTFHKNNIGNYAEQQHYEIKFLKQD